MDKLREVVPGILFCLAVMLLGGIFANILGFFIAKFQGIESTASPISPIFVAIILGLLIRNILGLPDKFKEGVSFSIGPILKSGIILLGIRLNFLDVLKLGLWGIPIILTCVLTGLFVTLWITRSLHQSQRLGVLNAVGSSICGVTAIVGISPGIKSSDEEIAYAVANVTLFGILAMFFYPYLANILFQNDPIKIGLFLGTAIHETSQVAGAALIYDQVFKIPQVIDVATITKLTRNSLLVFIVPAMTYYYLNEIQGRRGISSKHAVRWYKLVPLFVLGFIAMAAFRTIGDAGVANNGVAFGFLSPRLWTGIWQFLSTLGSKYFLGIAMAGIGLTTSIKVFKGLGIKPFYIGMAAALSVSIVSLIMVSLLGGFIKM